MSKNTHVPVILALSTIITLHHPYVHYDLMMIVSHPNLIFMIHWGNCNKTE